MNGRYANQFINIDDNPVIIVGQNPGSQRDGITEEVCWQNNRSADFLHEIIDGLENIILTNAVQYRVISEDTINEGQEDLRAMFTQLSPRLIICLGAFAHMAVKSAGGLSYSVQRFYHPSYVLRFNKDRVEYSKQIRKAITK